MSHTPGPLEMFEDNESIGVAAGDDILARMTVYSTNDPDYPDDVQRANATLWAAAPKLLAACQLQALTDLHRWGRAPDGALRAECQRLGLKGGELIGEFIRRFCHEAITAALPCPATGESAGAGGATGTE